MARRAFLAAALAVAAALLNGCGESDNSPIVVSAIGAPPQLDNPNLRPLDAPSAFLAEASAQGLVRFDATGEIEPALAQSWIVSDDGLRYTFRIRRAQWTDGSPITAEQVASRLRAAASRASRNRLKPVLGAIQEVVAMTDQVLEISLRGPRPNLLQLLAQPELAILVNRRGAGPYAPSPREDGAVQLAVPGADDEEDDEASRLPELLLRGEPAAVAVARFAEGDADLVTGGTAGDLPLARAARVPAAQLAFDPAAGLFGLAFSPVQEGPLADAATRRALSMAIDRDALVAGLAVPGLRPQAGLLPPLPDELTAPSAPDWAGAPLPMRRELAARAISGLGAPLRLRVALPEGAGYRLLFAYLRRDWRVIGVEAERVAANAPADLRLIDEVAPAMLASWYLRHFACGAGTVCDPAADLALEAARAAPTQPERQIQLAEADRLMTALVPYIPLCSPIRWSLVSPRLTGFRPNMFARHPAATLIAQEF